MYMDVLYAACVGNIHAAMYMDVLYAACVRNIQAALSEVLNGDGI